MTTTIGDLGTAALAEARRRVEAALVSSYGGEGKGEGVLVGEGDGGVAFWELPRLLGLGGGDNGSGAGGGKAWDLQGGWVMGINVGCFCCLSTTTYTQIPASQTLHRPTSNIEPNPTPHAPSHTPTTALWESSHAAQLLFHPSSSAPSLTGAPGGSSDSSSGGSPWLALASVAERDPAIGDVLVKVRAAVFVIECAVFLFCLVLFFFERDVYIWTLYIERE